MSHDRQLIRLDLDIEANVDEMVQIVAEEIEARIALGDSDVEDPAWSRRVAVLAADVLLDRFRILRRAEDAPRSRWE